MNVRTFRSPQDLSAGIHRKPINSRASSCLRNRGMSLLPLHLKEGLRQKYPLIQTELLLKKKYVIADGAIQLRV